MNRTMFDSKTDGARTYRWYQLEDGRQLETVEIPATVLRAICGPKELAKRFAMWERGQARQRRNLKIKVDLGAGVKMAAIANEHKITPHRVSQLKKEFGL